MKPVIIFGGAPCSNVSTIGLQAGIVEGKESKMFFEVVRLIKENPTIQVVFLENVANIVNLGLKDVIEALAPLGFTLQWTVRTASELGAPHQRKRWFLLALRGDGLAKLAPLVDRFLAKSTCGGLDGLRLWEGNEPAARVSFKPSVRKDPTYDDHWAHRSQTMGNAVVPVVVRKAFIDLVLSAKEWTSHVAVNAPSEKGLVYPFPPDGIVTPDQKMYALPKRVVEPVRHTVQIVAPGSLVRRQKRGRKPKAVVLAERAAAAAAEAKAARAAAIAEARARGENAQEEEDQEEDEDGETIRVEVVKKEMLYGRPAVKLSAFPTPRKGLSHASTLTERSLRDLPTIMTYCRETKEFLESVDFVVPEGKVLHQVTTPSPVYLAFLMGYPLEWTKIDRDDETLPAPLTRAAKARAKGTGNRF